MNEPPTPERHAELLLKYAVPRMGDYTKVGGLLSSILDDLERTKTISAEGKAFLRDKGLFDLYKFVQRLEETGAEDFSLLRVPEQRGPNRRRQLWAKYGIDFIDGAHMRRMIDILERVEGKNRIPDADVLWLVERRYRTPALRQAIHAIEADYFEGVFKKSRDPWAAVNASSHYRKAENSSRALHLLDHLNVADFADRHLQSAICTTKGGALRDQLQYDEALTLGMRAHAFDSRSFHPCTLLGALHFETGDFMQGEKWFAMAVDRGATFDALDSEVRGILRRMDITRRSQFENHLLATDPVRYGWLAARKSRKSGASRNS